MEYLLLLLAIGAVLAYFFLVPQGSARPNHGIQQRPSQQVGRLDNTSRFEQKYHVTTATNEATIQEAEARSTAAAHTRNMVDRADDMGVPVATLGPMILADHGHRLKKDELAFIAEIEKDKIRFLANIEVEKERQMIEIWLAAARQALLANLFAAERVRTALFAAYEVRGALSALPNPSQADSDKLTLMNNSIPAMEADYYARIGQGALPARDGNGHRRIGQGSDGSADSEDRSQGARESISPPKNRVGF